MSSSVSVKNEAEWRTAIERVLWPHIDKMYLLHAFSCEVFGCDGIQMTELSKKEKLAFIIDNFVGKPKDYAQIIDGKILYNQIDHKLYVY